MYECMHMFMYICICVYMCMNVYIYIHMSYVDLYICELEMQQEATQRYVMELYT